MKSHAKSMLMGGLCTVAIVVATAHSLAQQTTGTPGSPSATTTIDGKQLPPPDPKFGGEIEKSVRESKPWWPPRIVPPKGAPNVLLIITDDVGFAAPSTFGGVIPTPTLDRVASNGLRFTQFHTTSLCSPTRAALITGRNHHSVGFGVISEASTGYPGYNSVITRDKATIGRILRDNGYATSWFGKNHNTPAFQTSQVGPFDQWPIGMGFEYFYGFVSGETNQWQPDLYRNTTRVYPYVGNAEYNLTTDMADDAVAYLNRINAIDPARPFFLYYAPGGTHAPHHPTPEWIEKFKDKFTMGWNQIREQIFANQKKLGVIPPNATLTPWPEDYIKKWDALSAEEKKLFERQMEVYAAYLAYTDHEIGRVIQAVEDIGKLNDTLIIYISGDNGPSAEGGPNGTPNEMSFFNGVEVPVAAQMKFYDVWGSQFTFPHFSIGWAWAMSTPYKWTKQIPSYFGGTRNGMCISWPGHIKDVGGIRHQFHHTIDIVPTILQACGINAPEVVDGIKQAPIEGVSMDYVFDSANASAPSTRKTQYFEMFGMRSLYHDGWMASTVPYRAPWEGTKPPPADVVNGMTWQLFDLANDPTQNHDVASANPSKLKELQDMFWVEADKYDVLPLDASALTRFVTPRPSITAGRQEFVYTGPLVGTPQSTAPSILNRSFTVTAEIDVPANGEGMLVTAGGRFGGWGFYLLKGKPVFCYNLLDLERLRVEGPTVLAPGKHTIEFDFKIDGPGFGKGGTGVMKVDGAAVSNLKFPHTLPFTFESSETFDVASDTGTGVDDKDYQTPFAFNGELNRLIIKTDHPQISPP